MFVRREFYAPPDRQEQMKRRWIPWLAGVMVTGITGAWGQTAVDLRTQGKNIDFSAAVATKPNRVVTGALPPSCSVGESVALLGAGDSASVHTCSTGGRWRAAGVLRENHSQAFDSATDVTVTHGEDTGNLLVLCFDPGGQVVEPDLVQVTGPESVLVRFATQQSGRCVVNAVSGAAGPVTQISGEETAAINSGSGAQILKAGSNIEARSLSAGSNITITQQGDEIVVASQTAPPVLTNSGAGAAVLKSGSNITARSLTGGTNVTVTEGLDTITISAADGEMTLVANSGGGAALLKPGTNVTAKTLMGGSNITVVEGTDTVTIHAAAASVTVGSGLIGSGAPNDPVAVDATVVPAILRQTFSNDFGDIANAACSQQTFTLTGATAGQSGIVAASSALPAGVNLQAAKVTAANVVAVEICNLSGSSYDPADMSYTVALIQ